MCASEQKTELIKAIDSSTLLSQGQKDILKTLSQFNYGVSTNDIISLMNTSKQALYFNMKKLLDRGFVLREKGGVYTYTINPTKNTELIDNYNKLKKLHT